VAASPAGIWWWKDFSLLGELELLYERWRGHGRPRLEDYEVSFAAVGAGVRPPPGSWRIQRRFFQEIIQLAR
jgi:hypothetical protein